MAETEIVEKDINEECLHCRIVDTIAKYFEEYGEKNANGVLILDIPAAIESLAHAIGDFVNDAPTPEILRDLTSYAQEEVNASIIMQRKSTDKPAAGIN